MGRRLLGGLLALTLALLVADLAGSPVATAVRRGAATVVGPVQRVLSAAPRDELARLEAENVRLRAAAAAQAEEQAGLNRLQPLLDADVAAKHPLIVARVVATGLSAVGGRRLTLDAGSRDGIAVDSTVVAVEGLVGRVVAVAPFTCDVQVLGSAGAVVGVRVGAAGELATVGSPTAADPVARPRGTLALTFVHPGRPAAGDLVRTLGSIDDTPYAAGLLVGTVTALDPEQDSSRSLGTVTRTGTVRPAVDPDTIDVVGVLVPRPRTLPRTPVPPHTASNAAPTTAPKTAAPKPAPRKAAPNTVGPKGAR
ncbi:MAG: rod shape-determining protein MreC [Humibacillus sp.]|nr:rod shape-determining protein MreC [Humibacillus sp.]MDN5777627.1 rod shape-determining protein MreC [Humibacillus sp.]